MSTLPASGYIENAARTNAEQKVALEDVRDVVAELLGGSAMASYTIAAGSITPAVAAFYVDTEGGAASDDLSNIVVTNHPAGRIILFRPADPARTIVAKNAAGGAGQIIPRDGNDFTMDENDKWMMCIRISNNWYETYRSYGSSLDDHRTYLGLGSAAEEDVGVATGDAVQLINDGGSAGLPAVKGTNLTTLPNIMGAEYLHYRDEKASGTDGGTFTVATWNVRDLNTEVTDETGASSVGANRITLEDGTYYIKATAPGCGIGDNRLRWKNTTATITLYGPCAPCGTASTDMCVAHLEGKFTCANPNHIFELQHYGGSTEGTVGEGRDVNDGSNEIYADVQLWKVE